MAHCSICTKIPKKMRDEIDAKLVAGIPHTTIAKEYFPDKKVNTVLAILSNHKNAGHIMQKAQLGGLEVQTKTTIQLADMITKIFERALILSMKAEEAAVTSRDFESSARCLDTAVRSLAILGTCKGDKESPGVTALEEYINRQRAKAAQPCN